MWKQETLQETEPIDIQQEIESYSDECDIKSIVRKASFDPQFLKSLSEGALNDTYADITEFPQNIHEYHQMVATAQANAMKLEELQKMATAEPKTEPEAKEEEKWTETMNGTLIRFQKWKQVEHGLTATRRF